MILDGEFNDFRATSYVKKLVNIDVNNMYTVVVLEPISDTQSPQIIAQLEAQVSALHVLTKGGRIIMICEDKAGAVLSSLKDMPPDILNLISSAAAGHTGKGYKGVFNSYQNALLGLSQKIMPGTEKIIPPMDTKRVSAITISAEDGIRLCGYVQAGEKEEAQKLLDTLVNAGDTKALDVFAYKSYLFNISNIIIRSAEGIKDNTLITKLLDQFTAAFAKEDHHDINQTLADAVGTIAEQYLQKMKSANKTLNERLIQYINENIDNPRLSADMIADEFLINQAYLRRFFKEKNGIVLWDYINMKRIEIARDLLITSNITIKQICLRCGYVSISTFIRTFKKFSGMTPGRYRSLYR